MLDRWGESGLVVKPRAGTAFTSGPRPVTLKAGASERRELWGERAVGRNMGVAC